VVNRVQFRALCLVATVEGSYPGLDAQGRRVLMRIPKFEMRVPEEDESSEMN
jgi:uncharacterized protein affecting Mg2+/Co2+ transport